MLLVVFKIILMTFTLFVETICFDYLRVPKRVFGTRCWQYCSQYFDLPS